MAVTSAWAVGSLVEVTLFQPSAMISSPLTTTQPKGPPAPLSMPLRAKSMARCMNVLCLLSMLAIVKQKSKTLLYLFLFSDQILRHGFR